MMQFTRMVTLRGPERETMAWAAEITAEVSAKTGLDVTCWASAFGRPVGTLIWSTMVESHDQLFTALSKTRGDPAYAATVAKATAWLVTPAEDALRSFVSMHGEAPTSAVGSVAFATRTVIANGKLAEAMAWADEVAEYASQLTGLSIALMSDVYGMFGAISWLGVLPNMAAVDSMQAVTMADAGYMQRMIDAGDLFVPTMSARALAVRIA